jgi:hypothetical protein
MKKQHIRGLSICLVIMSLLYSTSCKKDEGGGAALTLSKISTIKNLDGSINGGNMGDWIAIHGTSLQDISGIKFNDVEVDLEEIYEKDDIVYLQIPVKLPLEVTNKLYLATSHGEIDYNFTVTSPDLELTGMFNEYTPPGDTIRVYGKFIKLYEVDSSNAVVLFGNLETPVISSADNFVTARVPLNVQSNVKVKLRSNKYNAVAACPGFYQDKKYVITTFDSDFPYTSGTGSQWVGEWPEPKPVSGKYIRFEVDQQKYPSGLGWFYLMENSYNYTLDMVQHPENYVLKFELNMKLPIKATNFFVYYYWAVAPTAMGGETFTVQNLGRWQTLSIPLEKIIPMGNTGTSTSYSLNFRVENFAPVEQVAMYFDNFRIYKKGE